MPPRRNSIYLRWIRTLPCVVCGSTRFIEAAHTGAHGLGQKSPDSSAIPLCVYHHRTGRDSYHKLGGRRFAETHGLHIREIVDQLNVKPRIFIESGVFVGFIGEEAHVLGPICTGVDEAIRKAIHLKRAIIVNSRATSC